MPEARGVEDVGAGDAHLRQMRRRPEPLLARFVEQRRQDLRIEDVVAAGENLQPVHPLLLRPLRELARLFRRIDRAAVPVSAQRHHVRDDARRNDLVARAAIALVDAPVHAVAASRLAHGRHAVRHPQLEHVLRGRALVGSAGVTMQVDETRQHVEIRRVDLFRRVLRPVLRFDRDLRKSDASDLPDAIAFDDDVHRTDRRRAGSVDERGAADDQPLKRTFAFISATIRCVGRVHFGRKGRRRKGEN